MSATHAIQSTASQDRVLSLAIELSLSTWKLAFTVGAGQKPRIRSVPSGTVMRQIAALDRHVVVG
jgi:hypothetical protein